MDDTYYDTLIRAAHMLEGALNRGEDAIPEGRNYHAENLAMVRRVAERLAATIPARKVA